MTNPTSEDELTNVVQYSNSDREYELEESSKDRQIGVTILDQLIGNPTPGPSRLRLNPSPRKRYIRDSRLNPTIPLDRAQVPEQTKPPETSTPPNGNRSTAPDTPTKTKKSPVVIQITKKRPSPIKYPKDSDQGEQPDGEDVPLSRLLTGSTPRPTRRVTRQDLRIRLDELAPNSKQKLQNDRGPPSSRLRRKTPEPWLPWLKGCAPKCRTEHRHQPFMAGREPNCPEIPRDQWQKEKDNKKIPRDNPQKHWFNSQICQTDSSEEGIEERDEDEITTDELGTANADSSEEEN